MRKARNGRSAGLAALVMMCAAAAPAAAGCLDAKGAQGDLERLAAGAPGTLGACIADDGGQACVRGRQPMPMQSVAKLLVAFAALDAAEHGRLDLDAPILVRRQDLSAFHQPIAKEVGPNGLTTTLRDLIVRAVVQSDSAAADILTVRLGGPEAVQAAIRRRGLQGLRVDRDERHEQAEIVGLSWRPGYVDDKVLQRAIAAVPKARRQAAFDAYRRDERDTATPEGMARFLLRLERGELLSPASTRFLLDVLERTTTFPTRLKAGLPAAWRIGHKTGTSGAWRGLTAASNDVGLAYPPHGPPLAVAAFLKDSRADGTARDRVLAQVARVAAARCAGAGG